ncbi:MAG: tetratricopeptide repeat protein [Magnetovibrionaceae bacterium]
MADDLGSLLKQAFLAVEAGELERAESQLGAIQSVRPDLPPVLGLFALIYRQRGDAAAERKVLQRLLQVTPGDASTWLKLARLERLQKNHEVAEQALARAQQVAGPSVECFLEAGDLARDRSDWPRAIAQFQAACQLGPNHEDAWRALAFAYHDSGQFGLAEAPYLRLLALKPDDAQACSNLSQVLINLNRREEALTYADRALAIDPDYVAGLINRGTILAGLGRTDAAIFDLRAAVRLKPADARPWRALGFLALDMGHYQEAVEAFAAGLAALPGHIDLQACLGRALVSAGHLDDAERVLTEVLERAPHSAEARRSFADLLRKKGEDERARKAYLDAGDEASILQAKAMSGETPAQGSAAYARRVFDAAAEAFDQHMLADLDYRGPMFLRSLANDLAQPADRSRSLRILDLGCGTGLSGKAFDDLAETLHGVDVAPNMIRLAAEKGCYHQLFEDEIADFLADPAKGLPRYDWVLAVDLLIYLGDPGAFFAQVKPRLETGGRLLLTTEKAEPAEGAMKLRRSCRFAHSDGALAEAAQDHGFSVLAKRSMDLRKEQGKALAGSAFVLQVAG